MDQGPKLELKRDLMHSLGLAIPIGYSLLPKETVLLCLIPVFFLYVGSDLFRLFHKGFRRFFYRFIGSKLLKDREEKNLIGSSYFLIGAVLTILFFDREAALPALFIAVLADIAASGAGSLWGKHRLFGSKSLEGSAAFLLTSLAILQFAYSGPWLYKSLGALMATLAEALPLKLDDNLVVPLVAAAVLQMGL